MIDSEEMAINLGKVQVNALLEQVGLALSRGLDGYDVANWVTNRLEEATKGVAEEVRERILDTQDELLAEQFEGDSLVRHEIRAFWGDYLDRFMFLIRNYYEVGALCNRLVMSEDSVNKYLYVTNSRLHALACRVANEIHCLLSAGFSDGALLHVRTMYEYEVVSRAIWQSEDPAYTAEKYEKHSACDERRRFNALEKKGRISLFDDLASSENRERIDELKKEYGKTYVKPWGWANHLIKGSPSFTALDEAVSGSEGVGLYQWSSQQIHATSDGLNGAIGLSPTGFTLLSGPTDIISPAPIGISLKALNVICKNFATMIEDQRKWEEQSQGVTLWLRTLNDMSVELYEEFYEIAARFIGAANELMVQIQKETKEGQSM